MTSIVGDPALASRAQDLLGTRHRVIGVARVTADGTETATVGASVDADFEIGSISKGITGLLYVDAVARREVTPQTRLGELLPIGSTDACGLTLGSLATHTSGLPRLAPGSHPWRGTVELWTKGTNPYGETTLDGLVEQARQVRVGSARPRYSNFGFSLLGHAVAAAAATTYAGLVRRRLAEPLRLDPFYVAATPADLAPTALTGTNRSGRSVAPWTGEAIAPAGGVRASVDAMARLVRSVLDATVPGLAALDPVRDFSGGVRIGAGWITISARGRSVTWHNGGTGGFRSWLGVDRQAGCGVVVLSATSRSVDRCGFRLLDDVAPAT